MAFGLRNVCRPVFYSSGDGVGRVLFGAFSWASTPLAHRVPGQPDAAEKSPSLGPHAAKTVLSPLEPSKLEQKHSPTLGSSH